MDLHGEEARVLADPLEVEPGLGVPVLGQAGKGADGGPLGALELLCACQDAVIQELLDLQRVLQLGVGGGEARDVEKNPEDGIPDEDSGIQDLQRRTRPGHHGQVKRFDLARAVGSSQAPLPVVRAPGKAHLAWARASREGYPVSFRHAELAEVKFPCKSHSVQGQSKTVGQEQTDREAALKPARGRPGGAGGDSSRSAESMSRRRRCRRRDLRPVLARGFLDQ